MKKFLSVIIFITLVTILSGCQPKEPENNNLDHFSEDYIYCKNQERFASEKSRPFNDCMNSWGWYEDEDGNWFKK